jgi:hypothetical protein
MASWPPDLVASSIFFSPDAKGYKLINPWMVNQVVGFSLYFFSFTNNAPLCKSQNTSMKNYQHELESILLIPFLLKYE